MFSRFLSVLEKVTFWFTFVCVVTFCFTVVNATVFGTLPTSGVAIALNSVAILWCLFAGTLPILYLAFTKVKSMFERE